MQPPSPSIFGITGVIPNPLLNRLGLQVGRVVLSRAGSRMRQMRTPPLDARERSLRERGFCVMEDFLPNVVYASLRSEYWRIMQDRFIPKRRIRDTRGYIRETFYVEPGGPAVECERHIRQNAELRRLLRCPEGVPETHFANAEFQVSFWRHWLDDGFGNAATNEEQSDHSNFEFHSDTFYTISKAFLYVEPVNIQSGAHRYAPRSHRLSPARLAFEYRNSISKQSSSPRVAEEELQRFGDRPIAFALGGNSLIVENTFGFHAAGRIEPGLERNIIYVQFRWPPFGRLTRQSR